MGLHFVFSFISGMAVVADVLTASGRSDPSTSAAGEDKRLTLESYCVMENIRHSRISTTVSGEQISSKVQHHKDNNCHFPYSMPDRCSHNSLLANINQSIRRAWSVS